MCLILDGKKVNMTMPNAAAQEQLIREAIRLASVKPSDVAAFETHGTGTQLGDKVITDKHELN
jgi:acyl transferase domain-containing protein